MIVHMVILKIRRDVPKEEIARVFQAIGDLKGVIPGILSYTWGPYSSPEGMQRGHTHGFCMTFSDAKSRDVYLPHPAHEKVKAQVLPLLAGGIDGALAFDYETR